MLFFIATVGLWDMVVNSLYLKAPKDISVSNHTLVSMIKIFKFSTLWCVYAFPTSRG